MFPLLPNSLPLSYLGCTMHLDTPKSSFLFLFSLSYLFSLLSSYHHPFFYILPPYHHRWPPFLHLLTTTSPLKLPLSSTPHLLSPLPHRYYATTTLLSCRHHTSTIIIFHCKENNVGSRIHLFLGIF
ncbi:hypothetical protein ERO13_D10G152999v2 [Gossypium hirsutum]|nr:hypothetical protein ERO13_D10G152999v2 [Gossypium hirsutum]